MNREICFDKVVVNDDTDCYVIAEIGHNHQGDLQKSKDLILAAYQCGANAVKLQKRDNRTLFTKEMYDRPYDNPNSYGETYGKHREHLEFGHDEYAELKQYCEALGVTFFSTPFDIKSADFLNDLEMPMYKIASADLLNLPLIKHVAHFGKPMIVSTGGSTLDDVRRVYEAVMPINSQLCILQCTASYPCNYELLNLKVIETFRHEFPELVIGLSAHDNGIAMGPVAYMLGARVIEKHFTLNRAWKGTDHAFSLQKSGMERLVRDLKRTRVALGDGVKHIYDEEKAPITKMSKKLVASHDIPVGHILTLEDIAIKSPGDGLPPYEIGSFIGKRTKNALIADENITYETVEELIAQV